MVSIKNKHNIGYFIPGLEKEADIKARAVIILSIHNDFKSIFKSIACYQGTFSLQAKMGPNHIRHLPDMWYLC